jgi:transcriptional regulator with XRE-family HTH domain
LDKDIKLQRFMETVASNVRSNRERLGLTQAQLADRMGTKQPVISQLERSKQAPSVTFLVRLANAFDIEIIKLLGGK